MSTQPLSVFNHLLIPAIKIFFLTNLIISFNLYAESGRSDYDLDDDGLIEINDSDDFLNIVTSWGKSSTLYEENLGCPNNHCNGYELSNDIDFSAGQTNTIIVYPKVLANQVFEGNGHTLKNMRLAPGDFTGLFDALYSSTIRNLNIDFGKFELRGGTRVGGLAIESHSSIVLNCKVTATIRGTLEMGGLLGIADNTTIINSHFNGIIYGGSEVGGLIGIAINSIIYASSVKGEIHSQYSRDYSQFGMVGNDIGIRIIASQVNAELTHAKAEGFTSYNAVEASYAINLVDSNQPNTATLINTHQSSMNNSNPENRATVAIEQLKCPTSANNTSCSDLELFPNWNQYMDEVGNPIWNFGDENDLPFINENLVFYGYDDDGDNMVNMFDAFPNNSAASIDQDRDGLPDQWNSKCKEECQEASGLTLDSDKPASLPIQFFPSASPEKPDETDKKGGFIAPLELLILFLFGCIAMNPAFKSRCKKVNYGYPQHEPKLLQ